MAILTKKLKTGGGHWYDANGKACHTQPKAKGDGERSTTLTDARKLKLFPSVTTILGIFAKPGLERWKMKSIAEVAFDIPRIDGEDAGKFADRCMVKQAAPVEEASDFGTRCHDAIEKYFEGEPVPDEPPTISKSIRSQPTPRPTGEPRRSRTGKSRERTAISPAPSRDASRSAATRPPR
jgi:hypothetical protein